MGSQKSKMEKILSPADLASYLRALASAIEGRGEKFEEIAGFSMKNFKKIRAEIRLEGEKFNLRLKTKPQKAGKPVADIEMYSDSSKYGELKRRMKKTFASLKKTLAAGETPGNELVMTFIKECELMTSYPGYGDEYYDPFNKALKVLDKAFSKKKYESIREAILQMDTIRKECHTRYK